MLLKKSIAHIKKLEWLMAVVCVCACVHVCVCVRVHVCVSVKENIGIIIPNSNVGLS